MSSISTKLPEQLIAGDELPPVRFRNRFEKGGFRFWPQGEGPAVLGGQDRHHQALGKGLVRDLDLAVDDSSGSHSHEWILPQALGQDRKRMSVHEHMHGDNRQDDSGGQRRRCDEERRPVRADRDERVPRGLPQLDVLVPAAQ